MVVGGYSPPGKDLPMYTEQGGPNAVLGVLEKGKSLALIWNRKNSRWFSPWSSYDINLLSNLQNRKAKVEMKCSMGRI